MQTAQRKPTAQLVQHPPLPPNPKSHANLLTPRQPYLARTNSNSKSFKKSSAEKSTKQKQIELELKYALPIKIQTSLEKSTVRSQNNLGELQIHTQRQLQNSSAITTQNKSRRDDRDYTGADKVNSTKPFDGLSGVSGSYDQKTKGDQYYLYWKGKAHEYLESNMKLMEDVRNLTRENAELRQRVQVLQLSANSVIMKETKSSELVKQSTRKEQNRTNAYIVQKMEEMQRELKKKEIVVKAYEEKIIELNARIVADNERSKLISKLKSQIDSLKAQLHGTSTIKNNYVTAQNSVIQERFRSMSGRGEFRTGNYDKR